MVYGHPFTTFIFAIIDRPIGYRSGDLLLKLKFCDEWKPILYFIFPLEKYIHYQVIIRRNDPKNACVSVTERVRRLRGGLDQEEHLSRTIKRPSSKV